MKGVAWIALFFAVGNGPVLPVMVNTGLSVAAYVVVIDVDGAPPIDTAFFSTQFKPPLPDPQFISWLTANPSPPIVVVVPWDIWNVEAPSSNETKARI